VVRSTWKADASRPAIAAVFDQELIEPSQQRPTNLSCRWHSAVNSISPLASVLKTGY